jgi:hypothetical protein
MGKQQILVYGVISLLALFAGYFCAITCSRQTTYIDAYSGVVRVDWGTWPFRESRERAATPFYVMFGRAMSDNGRKWIFVEQRALGISSGISCHNVGGRLLAAQNWLAYNVSLMPDVYAASNQVYVQAYAQAMKRGGADAAADCINNIVDELHGHRTGSD